MKKIPMRTCVVTHTKADKRDLLRIVRTKEGNVLVDLKGKVNGRGAYVKKDKNVIAKAKKSKALDKKLEVNVPDEIYDELVGLIDGQTRE